MKKICRNCDCYDPVRSFCKRSPPVLIQGMNPVSGEPMFMGAFPPVKGDDKACGEYRPEIGTLS